MPLGEKITSQTYLKTLDKALVKVREFNPKYLVLAFGLDTAKSDPTGTWSMDADDFNLIGKKLSALGVPILVVQEGGYLTRSIGQNAVSFFRGLFD